MEIILMETFNAKVANLRLQSILKFDIKTCYNLVHIYFETWKQLHATEQIKPSKPQFDLQLGNYELIGNQTNTTWSATVLTWNDLQLRKHDQDKQDMQSNIQS